MFCKNCGRELDDRAVVCPNCGIQVGEMKCSNENIETYTLSIIGFILSFVVTIAGLICSIIAYRKCRDEGLNGKSLAIAGIVVSSVSMALAVIFVVIYIIIILGIFGLLITMPA